ncbi:hypothetical protein QTO34_018285 [Cnephaeus nilssonii]|uniref:Uncharacterized protein n=1 Tax=Cnephaeus nilssonii TaxID=3371016 RepID=A0AA40HYM4_CNENI|nr:hypothetical protein QTO34_018285 [Eptesicus nilssonii]
MVLAEPQDLALDNTAWDIFLLLPQGSLVSSNENSSSGFSNHCSRQFLLEWTQTYGTHPKHSPSVSMSCLKPFSDLSGVHLALIKTSTLKSWKKSNIVFSRARIKATTQNFCSILKSSPVQHPACGVHDHRSCICLMPHGYREKTRECTGECRSWSKQEQEGTSDQE